MDTEDEQCREVYAFYGLAMYCAQCLEREIAMSLATVFGPQNITRGDYDRLLESNFAKTMGRLISELAGRGNPSSQQSSLEADLHRTVEVRNLLAHNYFWQRATQFIVPSGREAMLAERESVPTAS